ncbi:MAG: hypothetical protein AAGA54_15275 [Myxococcota bacterium]
MISTQTEPMLGLRMLRGPTPISLPTPAWPLRPVLAIAGLACALTGCKSDAKSAPPMAPLDDLAAIESELDVNASRLESQGIRVAQATAPAVEPRPPELKLDDDGDGDDAEDAVAEESGRDYAGAVAPVPPPSAPADETTISSAESERIEADEAAPRSRQREKKRSSRRRERRSATSRCDRICDLAESTCELSDRICALANEHVDDVRYAEACTRAEAQCEAAAEACSACAD